MSQVISLLVYAVQNYLWDLLPLVGMLIVLVFAIVLAIRNREHPAYLRILSVTGIALMTFTVALEILQPFVQIYLEEELNIIFLEADKYTGAMRNLRYLLYPAAMFIIGYAMFDDRFEEGWDQP